MYQENGPFKAPFNGDVYMEQEFIKLRDNHSVNVVIETGTHHGITTQWLGHNFPKVYSIESKLENYRIARKSLKKLKNIKLYHADSAIKLSHILPEIEENFIVFLDAHWFTNPVIKELEAIRNSEKYPILVIHDFKVPDNPEMGYDKYPKQNIIYEWDWIKDKVNEIYGSDNYTYYYNKEATGAKRGCVFIIPKNETRTSGVSGLAQHKTSGANKIYCIGDSHVGFFSGRNSVVSQWPQKSKSFIPYFEVFRLGPVLAYNLCRDGTSTKGKENLEEITGKIIPANSIVLLCFGEIDCRVHLVKKSKELNRNYKEVVEECCNRYLSVILGLKSKGFEIIVWNVIPSQADDAPVNKDYPRYGTMKERNAVSKYFNTFLSGKLRNEKIFFIDIFDELLNDEGNTDKSFLYDDTHLSQKIMPEVYSVFKRKYPEIFSAPYFLIRLRVLIQNMLGGSR